MIPSAINSDYPRFVPNQVLTSDNLNDLFGYLDEQGRMTRTNLVGIGIVCGLQVKTGKDSSGDYIIITKGTGVTSHGYLVTVPEIKYHYYNRFDAVKAQYYDRFVNISDKTQKMFLWELKQAGEIEDQDNPFHALNDPSGFLDNKVVMLFVELLETNNKNCDPDSCDDKGVMVTVNFRPLLVTKQDAEKMLANNNGGSLQGQVMKLPEIKLPRFDVAATLLLDTEDIFSAYQSILTPEFISTVRSALTESWTRLKGIVDEDFPSDPFSSLESRFAFLNDGSITTAQAVNLQYYYDFFSDLLAGYNELRRKAFEVVCECVPDESLFPRHLLLGEAVGFYELDSKFRTRFIPSPVLSCCDDDAKHVKSLFSRLVLLSTNFSVTEESDSETFKKRGAKIKATPSILGKEPLSEKAIPFYYTPNKGSKPLYLVWDYRRTLKGTANQILSYNSHEYNSSDDFVKNPLKYDLEPYNFLRIEGHIGHNFREVMADLDVLKKKGRLPIDVLALSSDTRGIFRIIKALESMDTTDSLVDAFEVLLKHPSCFADIFLALDEWINKLRCCLLENKRYFYRLPAFRQVAGTNISHMTLTRDVAAGAVDIDPEDTIEKLYQEKLKDGTLNDKFCGDVFVDIATSKVHHATALVTMPYKIDGMIAVLPEHITQLDAKVLEARYSDLSGTSNQLRAMYASKNVADTMVGVDLAQLSNRLEMSCLVCLFLELKLLIREFLIRLLGLMIRQKFGFYAHTNPGIQHKAGVTMGGTFILVYHETSEFRDINNIRKVLTAVKSVKTRSGQAAAGIYNGDQALLSTILLLEEIIFLKTIAETEEEPNDVMDKIARTIQPGTVIADFYVPYLCTSICAPSQVVILPPAETPEEPNLPPVAKAVAVPDNVIIIPGSSAKLQLNGENSVDPEGKPLTFIWSQPAGQTGMQIISESNPITDATISQPGSYSVMLTVKDEAGKEGTDTVTVEAKMEEQPVKTCGPLSEILKEFKKWIPEAEDNTLFKEMFKHLDEVAEYFKALGSIVNKSVDDQIGFFEAGFNQQSTQDMLIKWLENLNSIILERKDLRLLSLKLYRILNLLCMYIVCIQQEDFDKGKVPMIKVFRIILGHVKSWMNPINQGEFLPEEADLVKEIGKDLEKEIERIEQNGESGVKLKYVEFLKRIIQIIQTIP